MIGLPPELTKGKDQRVQLPVPDLAVIEEKTDGVYLFRFTVDGRCVGDTWHESVEDAQNQAKFEYEDCVTGWKQVPNDVTDVVSFCLKET